MKYYIAIDGGGSKTEGILADEKKRIVARRVCGATNPNDIGEAVSAERLITLSRGLASDIPDDDSAELYSVFAGVAGAGNHRTGLTAEFAKAFPDVRTGVGTDADNLFYTGIPEGDGACLISGTGTVCYVRSDGQIHRIGGWGWLLDRGGSGYDLGRDALAASLESHDGRGDATLITSFVVKKLGGTPWDNLSAIYDGGKPFIALFAGCVFEADAEGDMVAGNILQRNAACLAASLDTAYTILGKPFRAVLGGGVFEHHQIYMERVRELVEAPAELFLTPLSPVFGALKQAMLL